MSCGQDIFGIDLETLLGVYAAMLQVQTLLNNSMLQNIRVGKRTRQVKKMLATVRLANCNEFALKLPQIYRSIIDEKAAGCPAASASASPARAFLKDASTLLPDEARANPDVENETVMASN